ncbi:hypothetical protein CBR_g40139 [Chara braunii]|uniref:3-hydroxy-3-methylglutaryl coenzyme A reductase n=1 Tax=Chara braunii TaxID=69332 RepID=A0A388LT57_CHABU|nr:hypothetical protein CBR_g40139 [Chara braunii]|eukprot:GBG85500.1 hypothetical protein CBR_g40139 [Chara braunii]
MTAMGEESLSTQGDSQVVYRSAERHAAVGRKGKQASSPVQKHRPLASDVFPLPIWLTNRFFMVLFFAASYYLLRRWREKIRTSSPFHLLNMAEVAALVAQLASFIYLIGFFGIEYVQTVVASRNLDGAGSDFDEDVAGSPILLSDSSGDGVGGDDGVLRKRRRGFFDSSCNSPAPASGKMASSLTMPRFVAQPADGVVVDGRLRRSIKDEEDDAVAAAVFNGEIPSHSLEAVLENCERAVRVRRRVTEIHSGRSLSELALSGLDYASVQGQCCEMVIGHVPIPVGVAGPLLLDGAEVWIPMATTEGCLVASTNRGCKAVSQSGGTQTVLLRDGMTRAPVVRFVSAARAAELKRYLEDSVNFETIARVFSQTSRFARLLDIQVAIAGRSAFLRFECSTGDAMGMNMVSKGVQQVLGFLSNGHFPDMEVCGLSGNYCSDKKATAVNWIQGRGKSVVCEAMIRGEVVRKVLKTSVQAMVELNTLKNLVGSAMAGALGGFNAHAANIVSAVFIATGQDPAQNVESSSCITVMEGANDDQDLYVSVTMPSIEVGTVGGGTALASQSANLNLLGVRGADMDCPGANARRLARIVAGAVLAGELSLMAALAAGHLVKSHLKYNRSSPSFVIPSVASAASSFQSFPCVSSALSHGGSRAEHGQEEQSGGTAVKLSSSESELVESCLVNR